MKNIAILLLATTFLTACGGEGRNTPTPTTPVNTNSAPTLSSNNANQATQVGATVNYDATQNGTTFTDPDGDTLTYTVAYAPSAQGLSDNNGVISGSPSLAGTITITITATDPSGASASDAFNVTINSSGGLDQNAVLATFNGNIDLSNLENYANQPVPAYITKLNTNGNPITDPGATLGRVLFYDVALSVDDTISCSSCHLQSHAFSDTNVVSDGVQGGVTGRHSMRLINTQFADETNFFWDERAPSLEDQTTEPLRDHNEHGFSNQNGRPDFNALITKISAIEYYDELFTFVYGDNNITEPRIQLALAQFVKSIQSFDSRFDQARAQATSDQDFFPSFTQQETNGKDLYFNGPAGGTPGAGCNVCHTAPEFDIRPTDGHNGVVAVAGNPGAFDFTNNRSPSLRDLVKPNGNPNGPFMHDGSQATLMDVIDHYDDIPVPANQADLNNFNATFNSSLSQGLVQGNPPQQLNLNQSQKDDLAAFLRTLTGTNVYTDAKYSDPF
ncbi:MAG: cytochrome c peroxidase [Maricaulaceae bacterium]